MTIILASLLRYYEYNDDGEKMPVAFNNDNGILNNIVKRLPHTDKFVFVANDPDDHADNDNSMRVLVASLEMAGLRFGTVVMLDGRNAHDAARVIDGAGLIVLRGGKCDIQLDFWRRIGMRDALKKSAAVVVGVSAGAMNLCKVVANFPEESSDLEKPLWLSGLDLCDFTVIPHFDGEKCEYQFPCADFDIAKEYILPMSQGREFIGIPNDGYIIIENDKQPRFYGDLYVICNSETKRLQSSSDFETI